MNEGENAALRSKITAGVGDEVDSKSVRNSTIPLDDVHYLVLIDTSSLNFSLAASNLTPKLIDPTTGDEIEDGFSISSADSIGGLQALSIQALANTPAILTLGTELKLFIPAFSNSYVTPAITESDVAVGSLLNSTSTCVADLVQVAAQYISKNDLGDIISLNHVLIPISEVAIDGCGKIEMSDLETTVESIVGSIKSIVVVEMLNEKSSLADDLIEIIFDFVSIEAAKNKTTFTIAFDSAMTKFSSAFGLNSVARCAAMFKQGSLASLKIPLSCHPCSTLKSKKEYRHNGFSLSSSGSSSSGSSSSGSSSSGSSSSGSSSSGSSSSSFGSSSTGSSSSGSSSSGSSSSGSSSSSSGTSSSGNTSSSTSTGSSSSTTSSTSSGSSSSTTSSTSSGGCL